MRKHLLIIGSVWPEPKSSAAGSRMMQLIRVFQREQYRITFASTASKSEKAFPLDTIGIDEMQVQLNDASFDEQLQLLNPNVVMFDRFMVEEQFGWRVSEHCPHAIRILDTEDLHFLRKGRQQALKDGNSFNNSYLFNDTAKRELASIYRCDLSLIISEFEMELLTEQCQVPASLLLYCPFMMDTLSDDHFKTLPYFDERQHFITIGNFLHPPNLDAVTYLKTDIWPRIRKVLPEAEMHLYGSYVSQKALQLHNEADGFLIKGFAEDVHDVMQNAKVCLVPLRFGAGLKGKLIDAMINGTPCVTTKIGAEGMYGDLPTNGMIENDPQAFADAAIALYASETLWKEKQTHGLSIINQRFDEHEHSNTFIDRLSNLEHELESHRAHNITGMILQHHSLQSTKYMSKWIEEKNKNNA